jgi:hypothetical protein
LLQEEVEACSLRRSRFCGREYIGCVLIFRYTAWRITPQCHMTCTLIVGYGLYLFFTTELNSTNLNYRYQKYIILNRCLLLADECTARKTAISHNSLFSGLQLEFRSSPLSLSMSQASLFIIEMNFILFKILL